MVEPTAHFRSYEPDIESLEQDITSDIASTNLRPRHYAFGRISPTEYHSGDSVPLFLSDPDGEPDPSEFDFETQLRAPRRASISTKILMATIAASAVAVLFALFSSDATRDILISAKASISTVLPSASVAAQAGTTQLTAHDIQLKEPARAVAPAGRTPATSQGQQVAMLPSREAISSAYQAALQSRTPDTPAPAVAPTVAPPIAAAPAPATPAPAPQMDPAELVNLMQRARGFLATGDLPSARLLLERAADAPDANAALLLAQTYDPDVLGTSDVRNIIAEPTEARAWYRKAAQLGSADAERRLTQLQN